MHFLHPPVFCWEVVEFQTLSTRFCLLMDYCEGGWSWENGRFGQVGSLGYEKLLAVDYQIFWPNSDVMISFD